MDNSQVRRLEVFSNGGYETAALVDLLHKLAGPGCNVAVRMVDGSDPEALKRAEELGLENYPAILLDGKVQHTDDGSPFARDVLLALAHSSGA